MARTRSIEMGELTDTIYYILVALLQPAHGEKKLKEKEDQHEK